MLVAAAILLFPLTAAQGIQTTYFNHSLEAVPGEDNLLGELQITADGTSLHELEAELDLPFNHSLSPVTRSELGRDESYNVTVSVTPETEEEPADYTRELEIESANYSTTEELEFTIPPVNNWTVNTSSIKREDATGTHGGLTTLQLEQTGNVPDEVEIKFTGNISSLLRSRPSIQVLPSITGTVPVNYDIPRNQETGNYTGQILLNGTNLTQTVNVSLQLRDEENPEITLTQFEDVEATQNTEFKLKARDNLEIDKVTGTVYTTTESGNTSEVETIDQFFFEHRSDDVYSYNFKETGQEGNYSINATVFDTAGNNHTVTEEFQIQPLDAVNVWNYNFDIGEVIQGTEKNTTILELEDKSAVKIAWHKIVPSTAKVEIGLRHESWEETKYFDEPGDSIEIQETGNYNVVATTEYGKNITEFNIELDLLLPDQHVDEPEIIFGGRAIQNFAEPIEFSEAGLHGQIFYSEYRNGVPVTKAVRVEGDATDCQGKQVMTECVEGLDLGAITDLTTTNQQLQSSNAIWKSTTAILGFSAIVVWLGGRRIRRNAGLLRTQRMIQYNNVATSPFFEEEDPGSKPGNLNSKSSTKSILWQHHSTSGSNG